MTDLMNDQVSSGNQGEQEQQGQWQENATTGANPEPTLTDSQGAPPPQPAQGQQQTGEGEVPAPNVQQRWLQGMEALGALGRRSQSDPLNQAEIDAALANLRRQYGFTQLRAEQVGEDWRVYARMNPDNSNNPITVEGETSTGETEDTTEQAPATTPSTIPNLSSGELVRIYANGNWTVGKFQEFFTLSNTQLIKVKVGNNSFAKPVNTFNQQQGWKLYTSGATRINYGSFDAHGRPTGIRATLGLPIPEGSTASSSIRPPGFQGGDVGHARGHLLGNQLGGSGRDPLNLVTLWQTPVNTPIMRGYEAQVRQAVESGQIVTYRVTPVYNGSEPMPIGVTIQARGDGGFSLSVSIPNRK
ncbi:MAG: hypothetical protein F6K38_28270 [Moorea sp. SIO3B2]|nr:hypothetical protein [Moorena sp. SIO3B2]